MQRQSNNKYGLHQWSPHSVPPFAPPLARSSQIVWQSSTGKAPVRIHKDQWIITHKPQLGPTQIPCTVPVNRLFRHHFGSPLEHNQTVSCHPRILTTYTSQAHPIASIGAENNPLFFIRVWSDLYASGYDKNDLLGNYIALVRLLCL